MRITSPAISISDIWDALVADYGDAGTYGLLLETNLDGKVSLAKADVSVLEGRLSAARALKLDNLDNIDSSLKELFYEHFGTTIDDDPDLVVSGTVTNPDNLVANSIGTSPTWDTIAEYVELTFEAPAYIKQLRTFGHNSNNNDGRAKLQAYVDGSWVDVLEGIVAQEYVWSSWTNLTTPSTAMKWRFTLTTVDTGQATSFRELELKGVKIG